MFAKKEDPKVEEKVQEEGLIANLLMEYRDVFPTELPPGFPLIRGIEHLIDLVSDASFAYKATYYYDLEETKELQVN